MCVGGGGGGRVLPLTSPFPKVSPACVFVVLSGFVDCGGGGGGSDNRVTGACHALYQLGVKPGTASPLGHRLAGLNHS